jgi:hypothetical protein
MSYAVHPLNKLPYSKLDSKAIGIKTGVIFVTYSSLIASSEKGRSRLQQLVQWCGHEFDGLLVFDEVMYSISMIINMHFMARSASLNNAMYAETMSFAVPQGQKSDS